jgi:hypothetical protein
MLDSTDLHTFDRLLCRQGYLQLVKHDVLCLVLVCRCMIHILLLRIVRVVIWLNIL